MFSYAVACEGSLGTLNTNYISKHFFANLRNLFFCIVALFLGDELNSDEFQCWAAVVT